MRPPTAPSPGDSGTWFRAVAAHAQSAYLRYSFTRGTEQEVAFLVDALDLRAGERVLDVGCGPGRHAHALARRGFEVLGVDISEDFVRLASESAPAGARFAVGDARALDHHAAFDVVISLCQGGFGLLLGDGEESALAGMSRALRPGGRLAVSAFSAYFAVRHLEDGDSFDAATGVNHERATVRDPDGTEADFDLWTTCFTPRELRLMAERAGLAVDAVHAVTPGAYAARPPDLEHPEFLLIASKQQD